MIHIQRINYLKIMYFLISLFFSSCSIKEEPNMETILDNFLEIYKLDKSKNEIYINEYQTKSDSIIEVNIYVGSKMPKNNHSFDILGNDDYYYSNFKGFNIYLRKFFIENNIVVDEVINKKKKIQNNLNWKKGKLEKPKDYLPPVSDIFESVSFNYNFKKNIILGDVNVVGYKKVKVNSTYPFIEVDTTSCININYYR